MSDDNDDDDSDYAMNGIVDKGTEIPAREGELHTTHFTVCIYAIPSGHDKPYVLLTFPDQSGVDLLIKALKQDKKFDIKTRLRIWINTPMTKPYFLKTEISVETKNLLINQVMP